jgi:hypothetical protein
VCIQRDENGQVGGYRLGYRSGQLVMMQYSAAPPQHKCTVQSHVCQCDTSRSIGHTVEAEKLRCRSTRESFRSIGYCSDLFAACTTGSVSSMFRLVVGVVRLVVDNDDTHACHIHGNSCAILADRIRNRSCQSIVGQVAVHHLQQQSTHGSKD